MYITLIHFNCRIQEAHSHEEQTGFDETDEHSERIPRK